MFFYYIMITLQEEYEGKNCVEIQMCTSKKFPVSNSDQQKLPGGGRIKIQD